MKVIKEFKLHTNLKGNVVKFSILLILPSILYCIVYSLATLIAYQGPPLVFYIVLYVIVIWAAFVYMIILFQFLQQKRKDPKKENLKSYFLPLWQVQTVYFLILAGLGNLSYALMVQQQMVNAYLITPILILVIILYIPLQVCSLLQIYDGKRNPFKIIKEAFRLVVKRYASCFYSLLALSLVAIFYQFCMQLLFDTSPSFVPASAVLEIMTQSNPFMDVVTYVTFIFEQPQLLGQVALSLCYGVVISIAFVYYIMFMICVYDEDIKI